MIKNKLLTMILLGLIILVINAAGVSAESRTLKLGNKEPASQHSSVALGRFAELVEEKTNGEIEIDTFFFEELGNTNTQLENTIQGVQDFYVVGYYVLAKYVEGFNATEFMYFYKNREHFLKFLKSDIMAEFEEELLQKTGLRVISTERNWWMGPYRYIAAKKPILTIDDIQGLRLRAPDSKMMIYIWEDFGAKCTVIPWSEAYLALSQGLADAVTGAMVGALNMKFHEVAPHFSRTDEKFQQNVILMNNATFESLTKDQQEAIYEAASEAGEYNTELLYKKLDEDLEEMKSKGAIFRDLDIVPLLDSAMKTLRRLEEEGEIPEGLLDKLLTLTP